MGSDPWLTASAWCLFGLLLAAVGLVAVTGGAGMPIAAFAGWGLALAGFGLVGAGIVLLAASGRSSG